MPLSPPSSEANRGSRLFGVAFWGTLVIPTTGTYYLAITNQDDSAGLWIDTSGNNNFEAGELLQSVGCCGNTAFITTTLNAGTYKIAFAVDDTGGGSGLTGRFQPGSWGVPRSGRPCPSCRRSPPAT